MKGLSANEVLERKRAGLANIVTAKTSRSLGQIIASNVFTYFNFVFAGIALWLILSGSSLRNLTFLPVIIANTLIGIVQELRAKRVLDKLEIIATPTAIVLRDGKRQKVRITELVQDDIILLKSGDQIPADARLLDGEISVSEALLTGESDEITKKPEDSLLSGSFVIRGEGYAVLTHVGDSSYAAELTKRARAIKPGEQSEIVKSLNKFVWLAGIAILPIGLIMTLQQVWGGTPYLTAVEATVAAMIGMIPEGLFLLASVTLVLSAMRLAQAKVLLHDMKSIETLARADILCVDKTGTITSGKLKTRDCLWLMSEADYLPALTATIHALPADSETIISLKTHFEQSGRLPKPVRVQGFSSRLKYSGVSFEKSVFPDSTFVLGAPELVLRDDFKTVKSQVTKLSGEGLRVLVFAAYQGRLKDKPLDKKATPLALLVLEDEIRDSAAATFRYFHDQGVAIKVISGDSPLTVSAVARRAGIKGAEHFLDLSNSISDEDLPRAVKNYTVFGRVTPADKRRLVKTLQAKGHTVAMTGDGVNDVLALKDADCSIAMASGASAAAGAAQMVLLESDFSKMPDIVSEGRRVVNNLERSGSLFIVKNIVSFSGAILTILLGITYPMIPAQISLISLWVIGLPSFMLAQIPSSRLIKGNFMKNILAVAVPTGLATIIALATINALIIFLGLDPRLAGTLSALTWVNLGLIHLFLIARPYSVLSFAACLFCLAGVVSSCLVAAPVYGLIIDLPLVAWLLVILITILTYPIILLARHISRKLFPGLMK